MELIIDASAVFTGLIGTGITKYIIFSNAINLFAPEYLFDEFEKHKLRIKELSGFSEQELSELFNKLKLRITIIPKEQFEKFLMEANSLIPDKDDTEYLALSLSMNKTPIWSNDPHFKEQSVIKIYATSELVKYLKSQGHEFTSLY